MVTLPMVLRGSRPFVASLVVALTLGSSHVMAAELDSATPEQKRAAQKMFEAGDELYEAGRFAEAAEAFRGSYGIVASPNSRLMLARALHQLGKLAEASVEYSGVAGENTAADGRYSEARQAAEAERDALRDRSVRQRPRLIRFGRAAVRSADPKRRTGDNHRPGNDAVSAEPR